MPGHAAMRRLETRGIAGKVIINDKDNENHRKQEWDIVEVGNELYLWGWKENRAAVVELVDTLDLKSNEA